MFALTLEGLPLSELARLFALFGGAMVVLYLLKVRRRRVQVPFSPLWARALEPRQSSALSRTLKRLGSLLIQLTLIALVLLALGDPKGTFAGCTPADAPPPPPRHTLILLDASASMATEEGGRTRLERALDEARRAVETLSADPSQRLMLVQVDAAPRPLTRWTRDRATLEAALARVGRAGLPLDTPTGATDALSLARDALRDREGAAVLFITDRAFDLAPADLADLDLRVLPIGAATDNLGLAAFNVRPYLDDAITYVAWYAVRNETDRDVRAHLHLYAHPEGASAADFTAPARLIHTEPLTLPARATTAGQIPELKFPGSRLMARVAVASDDPLRDPFPRDDLAFAVVPERRVLKVQLVSEGNLFLHAALSLRENIALTTVAPAAYRGPDGFDVTVIDAAAVDLSAPGDYVLIAPRDADTFPTRGLLTQPVVQRVDKRHPLARHLTLADANILEANRYTTQRGDELVATEKSGAPLLFTRRLPDGRRFVVLAFDVRQSLLPMSYAFPILMVNAISWFSADPEGLLHPQRAGLPISVAAPGSATAYTASGPAPAPPRRLGDRVQFTAQSIGIYTLTPSGADLTPEDEPLAVAVNLLSPDESRIAPRGDFPTWEPPSPPPQPQEPWLSDLWRALLLAALALALIEWLTWHRRWTV